VPQPSERADRILYAAGELMIRLGYRKVTIDDIARQAGIGAAAAEVASFDEINASYQKWIYADPNQERARPAALDTAQRGST
jgi:hypothetical protein